MLETLFVHLLGCCFKGHIMNPVHLGHWFPNLGSPHVLDCNSQKPLPVTVLAGISGSRSPRTLDLPKSNLDLPTDSKIKLVQTKGNVLVLILNSMSSA